MHVWVILKGYAFFHLINIIKFKQIFKKMNYKKYRGYGRLRFG